MESQFGMVKSVYDDVPYAANLLMLRCNANYQLQNTEFRDAWEVFRLPLRISHIVLTVTTPTVKEVR